MTYRRDIVVYGLGGLGFLCWVIAFIRQEYQSLGSTWSTYDLWVAGAILIMMAVIINFFWNDSRS